MLGKLFKTARTRVEYRSIHSPAFFSDKDVNMLGIIGNNSMLFTTIDTLRHHGYKNYPSITFFYAPFWMDKVHSDHLGLNWGQTINGFPNSVRNWLRNIRKYDDHEFVQWGDFQQARMLAKAELQKLPNVKFLEGEPTCITPEKNVWRVKLHHGHEILLPIKSFFYQWFRKPLTLDFGDPHTILYNIPKSETPPKMLVVGQRLAFIWILKHFPKSYIVNLKKPDSSAPELPSNKGVSIEAEIKSGRLEVFTTDQYEIVSDPSRKTGNLVRIKDNTVILSESLPIFAAAGLHFEKDLLNKIPDKQKFIVPLFNSKFVSPQNITIGSLPQTYTRIMNETGNAELAINPMFYYPAIQNELIKNNAKELGVGLEDDYFARIENRIRLLDNPLNYDQAIELYLNEFKRNPDDTEYLKLKRCLEDTFKDTQHLNYEHQKLRRM